MHWLWARVRKAAEKEVEDHLGDYIYGLVMIGVVAPVLLALDRLT